MFFYYSDSSESSESETSSNPESNQNPKLMILNSYDKLINLVDIHSEEILGKHAESDLFADSVQNENRYKKNL